MNYIEASTLLTGRCKDSRKIGNNTYLRRQGDVFNIRLHDTDIITFMEDGSFIMNSGGWKTATTKNRLDNIPVGYVSQEKGVWYYSNGTDGKLYIFEDGMLVQADGSCNCQEFSKEKEKAKRKLFKSIKKYSEDFVQALFNGDVPKPSAGDCFYCSMRTEDGKTLGSVSNSDHIKSHIEEKYYVPSLMHNACEEFGISVLARSTIGGIWEGREVKDWEKGICGDQIQKAIYRYVKKAFGFAS